MSVLTSFFWQLKRFAMAFFVAAVFIIIVFAVFVINAASVGNEPPEWFERYISEFVMIDFSEFSTPAEIQTDKLISFGVWKALAGDSESKKYPMDSKGIRYIDEKDVVFCIEKYFNLKEPPLLKSVSPFEYLTDKKMFSVPIYGIEDALFPKVKNITRSSSEKVILTVDCYSMDEYIKSENPDDLKPKKSIMITLGGKERNYKFEGMRMIS